MPNPYFDSLGTQEVQLYNDIMRETIYNHGIAAKYLLRDTFNSDKLLGRSDAEFNKAHDIDVVIVEASNLDANWKMYQQFGVTINKGIVLAVHKDSIKSEIGRAPIEGDIVYLPKWDLMLLMNDLDTMNILAFGGDYVYIMNCVLYEPKGEEFNTGVGEIDAYTGKFDDLQDNTNNQKTEIMDSFNDLVAFSENNPFSKRF